MKEGLTGNKVKITAGLLGVFLLVLAEIFIAVSYSDKKVKEPDTAEQEAESFEDSRTDTGNQEDIFIEDDTITKWEAANPDWQEPFCLTELSEQVVLRVMICGQDYASKFHPKFSVKAKDGFTVYDEDGEKKGSFRSNQDILSSKLKIAVGETVKIEGNAGEIAITSLKREQGIPIYTGTLMVSRFEEGYIIINYVPLEDYLYSVVPSEMPSRYPLEALKSQAVSARTYAYFYHLNPGIPEYGADMDDSVSYQVYNNIQHTEATTEAVNETRGMILIKGETVYPTYFFSTSCGNTTNEGIWTEYVTDEEHSIFHSSHLTNEPDESYACFAEISSARDLTKEDVFRRFITDSEADAIEKEEAYYRWNVTVPVSCAGLYKRMKKCEDKYPGSVTYQSIDGTVKYAGIPKQEQKVKDIQITRRLEGGVADELCIVLENNKIYVEKEYNIRMVLSDGISEIERQDGTKKPLGTLLPSGFFVLDCKTDKSDNVTGIIVSGGGLGHGVGMSQNGAKCLAEAGADYKEILGKFY